MVVYLSHKALLKAERQGRLWEVTYGNKNGRVSTVVIANNGLSASVAFAREHNSDKGLVSSCVTTALQTTADKVFKEYQEYKQHRTLMDPIRVLVASESVSLNPCAGAKVN